MNSTTLEVALGLAVIFFLVATFVTAANEALTRLLNVRSKALWATLETLLTATTSDTRQRLSLGFFASVFSLSGRRPSVPPFPEAPAAPAASQPVGVGVDVLRVDVDRGDGASDLTRTPSIWSLDYAKANGRTKVWHIPASVFTAALLELAVIKGSSDTLESKIKTLAERYEGSPLGQYLGSLSVDVASDIDKFTTQVGAWFDGQMQRLTESYRRLTKYLLAAIGLLAAVAFNVDALTIASGLATNADQRQAVLLLADDIDGSGLKCPATDASRNATSSTDRAGFGKAERIIDTSRSTTRKDNRRHTSDKPANGAADISDLSCAAKNLSSIENLGIRYPSSGWADSWQEDDGRGGSLAHLVGLLITALAVGLGGPFWFDTVNSLAGLRRKQT